MAEVKELQKLYDKHNQRYPPTPPLVPELQETLFAMLKSHGMPSLRSPPNIRTPFPIFIVIDALDEIPDGASRQRVLVFLQNLAGLGQDFVHILVTGRPEFDIVLDLRQPIRWQQVVLDKQSVNADSRTFVRNEIERTQTLQTLSAKLRGTIVERLCSKEDYM